MSARLVVTQISIVQAGESPVFGENSIIVTLADEGAGPFVVVRNAIGEEENTVRMDFSEADLLLEAIQRLKKEAGEQ